MQIEDLPHWQPFDAQASLIGLAKQHGVTTSIVGWYIPYCPIFAKVATECYWSNKDAQDRGPTLLDASFIENVWFPLRILVEQIPVAEPRLGGRCRLERRGPYRLSQGCEPARAGNPSPTVRRT